MKPVRQPSDTEVITKIHRRLANLERRARRPGAGPFTALVPNEGLLADDIDCGYYLTNDGFVVFTGGLYWDTPAGYTPTGYGIEDPANDAINLFGTIDAFGGSTYAHHLLPVEARPVSDSLYVDLHAIEGDHGVSGLIRYETRVGSDGGWTITSNFSGGGTGYPVDEQGYTHFKGLPYNQFIMLEGTTWRVSD